MKHFVKSFTVAAALGICAAASWAGKVQVTVTDAEGKPAPDVVVLLRQPLAAAPVAAPAPVLIEQRELRFVPYLTVVPLGSTVRFSNRDGYDHHVRSMPTGPLGAVAPAKNFEFRLDAMEGAGAGGDDAYGRPAPKRKAGATHTADLKMDLAGAITLGCHLHSSMRGQLYVADTPWFGKTDASGMAVIDNVPEAASEVSVWHPEQLQSQAPVKLQVTATPASALAQLNFTPRKRRGS